MAVRSFAPEYLVVSLGCDTEVNDGVGTSPFSLCTPKPEPHFPLSPSSGSWDVSMAGFRKMGERVAALHLPTLIVQEGASLVF